MALGSKLSDREFDLEDIEFLSSAADQLAIGLDRIRLGREEVDFEQARRMQQGLLPSSMPQVQGLDVSGMWEPARAVGGDYYDVLELSPTQLAVCIGDVAGKGMPAALLMSALQAAVRASATENIAPKDLCERVRRVVVPSLGGRFVSFFFCTIDTQSNRLRFCNAGHNPPILARANGEILRLEKGGPVLSRLTSNTRFDDSEYEVGPGDRLLLFTDGVSEARDVAQNDFGEERLETITAAHRNLGARELLAKIVSEVLSFSAGRTEDDLTLVAVAVTQRA
jgi:serine phosphatase RsbU (regulator of sigma subunit)